MQWTRINNDSQLSQYCANCLNREYIAVDTEFVRTKTFYPIPGLIQIYNGDEIALVDPLLIDDWSSFQVLMASDVVKVFHASGEDLELLRHCLGCTINNLFDTQFAYALLGNEVSISFQRIVNAFLDIELDKSATRTDWTARPLSEKQLSYAASDVYYLYPLYSSLAKQLEQQGRRTWLDQEMEYLCLAIEPADPKEAYRSVSGISRLEGQSLNNAWYLACWRESLCREQNLARPFVLNDAALVELAELSVHNVQDLRKSKNLKPQQIRRWSKEYLSCLEMARTHFKLIPPIKTLTKEQQKTLKRLKQLISDYAQLVNLEPTLLASNRDLSYFLLNRELPLKLQTWRQTIIGQPLEDFLQQL